MAVGDRIITSVDLGEHVMQTDKRTPGAQLELLQKVGSTTGVITAGVDIFDTSATVTTDDVRLKIQGQVAVGGGNKRVSISSSIIINGIPFLFSSFGGVTATTIAQGITVFNTDADAGKVTSFFEFTLPETVTTLEMKIQGARLGGGAALDFRFETFTENDEVFSSSTIITFIESDWVANVAEKTVDFTTEFLANLPSIYSTP